jgi:thymidylate synthase
MSEVQMTRILPNQLIAHLTPAAAWFYAKQLIESFGDPVKTEDGKLTREIQNLHLCILKPLEGWPLPGSNWSLIGLNQYADQLLSGENPGFDYSYGNRIREGLAPIDIDRIAREGTMIRLLGQEHARDHYGVDQLTFAINMLKENPATRRAPIYIWEPSFDLRSAKHVPCLQLLDFLIRGGKLQCTAFFRSWDVGRAAVPNMYGLARLMEHVGQAVGVPIGSLTIIATSGHIYEA